MVRSMLLCYVVGLPMFFLIRLFILLYRDDDIAIRGCWSCAKVLLDLDLSNELLARQRIGTITRWARWLSPSLQNEPLWILCERMGLSWPVRNFGRVVQWSRMANWIATDNNVSGEISMHKSLPRVLSSHKHMHRVCFLVPSLFSTNFDHLFCEAVAFW
jgi:hypothetical protein